MSPKGLLLITQILFGLLVWLLVGGTDILHVPALCWVMFVAVSCWILSLSFFIIFLSEIPIRAPHIPWTVLSLCVNAAAACLYLMAAVVNTATVNEATRGRHNYKCWTASSCFAFLTALSYVGSSCLSFREWRHIRAPSAVSSV
ncbi:unnamed protein product [Knipowitschia caucasica]